MKPMHRFSIWFRIHFFLLLWKNDIKRQLKDAREHHFLWVGRFLFTWGWNGEKNTFSISFYKPDLETQIWSIGDY